MKQTSRSDRRLFSPPRSWYAIALLMAVLHPSALAQAPPFLQAPALRLDGTVQFDVISEPGRFLRIDVSTNLSEWQPRALLFNTNGVATRSPGLRTKAGAPASLIPAREGMALITVATVKDSVPPRRGGTNRLHGKTAERLCSARRTLPTDASSPLPQLRCRPAPR